MIAKTKTTLARAIQVLLTFLRPHRLIFAFIVFSVVGAEALVTLVFPQLVRKIVDAFSVPFSGSEMDAQRISFLFILACALYFFYWGLYRVAGFLQANFQLAMARDLDVNSLGHVLKHSYKFFQDQFAGSLMRKIQRLSNSVENVLSWLSWTILPLIVSTVGVGVLLWRESWILGAGMLAWLVIFVLTNYLVSVWKMKFDLVRSEKNTAQNGMLSDILSNATTVKAFSREKFEQKKFFAIADDSRRARLKSWYLSETNNAVQYFFALLLELGVIFYAIQKWEAGTLTVGAFAMYQLYIRAMTQNVYGLGRLIRDFYEALADAKEMIDVIDMTPGVQDAARAKALTVKKGQITFQDVVFNYVDGRRILDGFSLEFAPREKIALVGASGAGKSTVTKLLFRFYDVDGGSITIDGQDISRVTQQSLREAISIVPQEPLLFHRSLRENIMYGKVTATEKEMIAAAKKAHCHEFIAGLPQGYDTLVGERGVKLSGGERQRVAIARAILKNAPILVLDEATSSLDSESEALIQDALHELMKNKTVIVIAHRLSTIMEMDRIIVMEDGKVVDQGTHGELLTKAGIYKKLWSIQAGGFESKEEESEKDDYEIDD